MAKRRGTAGVVLAAVAVAAWLGATHQDPRDLLAGAEQVVADLQSTTTQNATTQEDADLVDVDVDAALRKLDELPIKGKAPLTGYKGNREALFGQAWKDIDRNGCDTRNDLLGATVVDPVFKPGTGDCVVLSGTLHDPYTGKTIDFVRGEGPNRDGGVQIDHVVSLGDVWSTGGQQLTQDKREALANDAVNLRAVDGPTNGAKQNSNAAEWLPPNKAYRCAYVAAQVEVKAKYGLWVTPPEHDAIARVLQQCTPPTEGGTR